MVRFKRGLETFTNFHPTVAITMVQALISQSAEIQKVLAFEGAFEKLFNTVTQEGGVEGGAVTMEALSCVDGLLRFNTLNQVRGSHLTMRILLIIGYRASSAIPPFRLYSVRCSSSRLTWPCMMRRRRSSLCNSGTTKSFPMQPLSLA